MYHDLSMDAESGRIPIIGFLTRSLEPNDTFLHKTWKVVCELAGQRGCHLLMVSGQVLALPDSLKDTMAAVFRLVTPQLLDGAILSQSVINRASASQLAQFDRELPQFPLVSVSIPLGGRPVTTIDNTSGLRALVRHLIDDHGLKKILHVRGPENNQEANDRERVWREELTRSGIAIPPEWVVLGDFDYGLMPTIGQDILDRVGRGFDAVVACNDMAAIRILEDFERLGVAVPGDVAVCGFDNIAAAQFVTPSLSTVEQPLEGQMSLVWQQLEALLRGEFPPNQQLGTTAVYRSSCGCPPERWTSQPLPPRDQNPSLHQVVSGYEGQASAFRWKIYHLNSFFRALNRISSFEQIPAIVADWLPRLGYRHFALLRTCSPEGTFGVWKSEVARDAVLPLVPTAFRVIAAFPETGLSSTEVLDSAGFSLSHWEVMRSPLITGLFPLSVDETWHGLLALQLTEEAGLLELSIQEQLASLLERLERERTQRETEAGIRARVVGQEEATKTLERLVAEVAHEINTPLAAILSSGSLLESRLVDQTPSISHLGLRFIEPLPSHAALPMVATRRQRRARLNQLLNSLGIDQAWDLAETLTALGVTASEEYPVPSVSGPDWTNDLEEIVASRELVTASRIVIVGAEKIRDFVERLRKTNRQRIQDPPEFASIENTIETALLLMSRDLPRSIRVERNHGDVPPVVCRPGELPQVWINLVRNAQQACKNKGTIVISTELDGPYVRTDVHDDGPGIAPEIRERIFEPFFTTRPQGTGLGLGLDIARNLVEDVGGRIACQSLPGDTTFSVWLRTDFHQP